MIKKIFYFTIIVIAISTNLFSIEIYTIGPYGGTFTYLEISQANPSIMYAGTYEGGIYKSSDAGSKWEYLAFRNDKSITSISTDCFDTNIVYISTGEIISDLYINTTYKSSDGGCTWENINIQSSIIKSSPIVSNLVYFGLYNKLYLSKDGGNSYSEMNLDLGTESISVIAPDPIDTSIIYIGTNFAVYKSNDSGTTWTKIKDVNRYTNYPGYVKAITISELNNNIVLIATSHCGLMISSDGGTSYKIKDFGLNVHGVICDEIDTNTIYVAHVSGFLKSTDLGDSFTELYDGYLTSSINSLFGYYVIESSLGEILRSTDKGQTWINSNQGINNTTIASIVFSNNSDHNLFAITNPGYNYQLMKFDNSNWSTILNNYAGEKIYRNEANNQMYMVNGRQNFSIATPPYCTWTRSTNGIPYCLEMDLAISHNDIYLVTSSIYDGIDAGIYKSTDCGENWSLSSSGLPEETRTYMGYTKTTPIDIYCIDINKHNTVDLFAGAYEDIFASCDEGISWFKISTIDSVYVFEMVIDNDDPDVIYLLAGNSNYNKPNRLYISYDYGLTFNECYTGLNEDKCIFYDKENRVLYIGGDSGLIRSSDKGISWECINEDWDNLIINCLYKEDGDNFIYAGTKESGIYKIQVIKSSINIYNKPDNFYLSQNWPNPLNPITTISYELPKAQNITLQVFDITGRLVETLYHGYKEAGHWDVTWNASGQSSGVYIYRLQAGDRCISKKMVVLK